MIDGVLSVLIIFIIMAVGFALTLKKTLPDSTASVLSVIVVKIAAPALAVISITDRFSRELLHASVFYLLILCVYILLLYITGKGLARMMHLGGGRKAVFEVTFTFSNTIFIGLPVNEIVFGHEALPYLFTFYLISLTFFWSLGAYRIAKVSPVHAGGYSLKHLANPALVGVLAGGALVQMNWEIPFIIDSSLRYLGALCVPLSLLIIGANLAEFMKGISGITRDEFMILVGKFIVSPIYMYFLLRMFQIEGLAFQVFMLTASMPCHMQTSILAEYYGVEGGYASKLVGLSTLISLVTIPVYVSILT